MKVRFLISETDKYGFDVPKCLRIGEFRSPRDEDRIGLQACVPGRPIAALLNLGACLPSLGLQRGPRRVSRR